MTVTLRTDEVEFVQRRQRDDTGRVFFWNGRVFRGIFPEKEEHVRSMFSKGFLEDLISHDCFPETWIADYALEGYALILEHKRIWPVIYPQDWTFSMLKDAALLICRTAHIAKAHGYNMRDCHGLNVLFDGVTPKFIDLGSFIPNNSLGWRPYEEFLRFYYYPLKMWQHNSFVGKLSIFSGNLTPHATYWRYKSPFFRLMSQPVMDRLIDWSLRPATLTRRALHDDSALSMSNKALYGLLKKGVVGAEAINLMKLARKIEAIDNRRDLSAWATYHENLSEKAERFDRIVEIIGGLEGPLTSAVDIGGNQGKFSMQLIDRCGFKEVVCIDGDENAIDAGYRKGKAALGQKIAFVHYDFMGGIAKLRFMLPADRFKSDIVTALALTHHLILSQGYDIDDIFGHLASYAKKYVLVEFMPLGLWVKGGQPKTPVWYTADWFRQAFKKRFNLLLEEKLRENNLLFVGKLA